MADIVSADTEVKRTRRPAARRTLDGAFAGSLKTRIDLQARRRKTTITKKEA
jgi:hypothetical protein